ncbi:MAG: hypothetical protein IKL68_02180 [Clostridia bacterium]|nr:hypothetical protein [Clostridia bacterium]
MATIFTSEYSGDYGYLYEFKVDATESNVSSSANTSKVTAKAYVRRTNSSANGAYNLNGTAWSITIDGTTTSGTSTWDTRNTDEWQLLGTASKTITHDDDGSKTITIKGSHTGNSASGASKMGNASGSGTFELTEIPRYATASQSLNSKTVDTIKMNWSSDSTIDYIWYSKDNGSTWTGINVSDGKSGTYSITGLSPNTTYKIKTRVRRKDSQLKTDSSALSVTTYDIARISTLSNFEHGDNQVVGITNPASISSLSLVMKIGDTQILSRTVKAGNNTITFSDTELDNIYKKYSSSSSLTATFILSGSGYTNSKTCTITLKGNQKTIRTNVSANWKRGKVWTNVGGTWKKAVIWTNVAGTWKRSI